MFFVLSLRDATKWYFHVCETVMIVIFKRIVTACYDKLCLTYFLIFLKSYSIWLYSSKVCKLDMNLSPIYKRLMMVPGIEYRSDDITKNKTNKNKQKTNKQTKHFFFFFHFSDLDTMYRWSMTKNSNRRNLLESVSFGSWGIEIWPHEYLISPIEISVNWPGFKQLWIRPILHWFQWAN